MVGRRGRVKLQFIMDRAERKRTQEKRLPVLLKKAREFTALCDVPTCLVVYLPGEDRPVIWPSRDAALDVVRRYREVGDLQRFKHKLDGAEFIGKQVDKAKAELSTAERQNRDKEINLLLQDFFAGVRGSFADLSPEVHAALEWMVEKKLGAVMARLQELRGGAILAPPLPSQVDLVPSAPAMIKDMPMLYPVEMVQPPPLMMAPPYFSNQPTPSPPPPVLDAGDGLATTDELQAVLRQGWDV